ncbi:MAG: ATP-binding protein [Arenimonas sp.]
MHAVREQLLEQQARALGLPVWKVPLPWPCSNDEYEALMTGVFDRARAEGIDEIAYGDLFLEDVRAYREARHAGTGLRATLTCVDPKQLSASFAGREFDAALLDALPPSVDPCGENGEFHTFAHAGPMFASPVAIVPGEIVERDGFVFADLLPG